MGLPEVRIEFIEKAVSAVQRSSRGIVALILKDDTKPAGEVIYNSINEVVSSDWTAENKDYIEKTFLGVPSKVIIERIATTATDYNAALSVLKNKRWNYLAIPNIASGDVLNIATWIKSCRDNDKKTFKAVLPNIAADHEGIINFCTDNIKVGAKTYLASEYTCRIAGILAGLPFTRSSTYYVLSEVEAITESDDPDEDIDSGKLILINDGEKIKIARGVNSLTTTTSTKGEDFKKIRIIEAMDLVRDDIRDTFENDYAGKYVNKYDNKIIFLAAVNSYFKELVKENILDPSGDNIAEINIQAQRDYLQSKGVDISKLSEQQIKEYNTGSKLFIRAQVKFLDAMEDLYFEIYI
ncbi:Phage tail sheath protein [Caloramator quimbayensis]|uniref:Phage tail sheath protein n=1 Tax=Caloramator quimbayensis TaxID=1147123 RepID=A0A1T4YCC4_9CLOT|nr:phage tail sheath C-terminal domain-containing protein [Caloramator quimbayensis]SKA99343.1 Phage tail sheath protein [Caloramator quimbayensis]